MKKFTLLLTLVVAFCSAYAQKSWVSFTSEQPEQAAITILQSDRAGLTLEVTVPGMFSEQISESEMTFQKITLLEGATTKQVGLPELPMLNELIGIPDNLAITLSVTDVETTKLTGYNIYPFQTPTTDNPGGYDHEFVMDKAFYSRVVDYPAENVFMDQPNIWRDVKVSGLHVTPFTYNPATQELEVITHMTIQIEFAGSDNNLVLNRSKEITPKFYNMYQNAVSNFGDLGYTETLRDANTIKYLVITNTEALDAIQPLVDYKNQMGHKVEVRTLETGFDSPQHFKDYISELYDLGLEYVLMVGDAYPNGGSGGGPNIVPMYYWSPGGDASYSDSWYTCLDGPDDHYADLAIGRIVYNNNAITELELQIEKTMTHYLTPDVSDNWAENTILIAHKEQYPGKYTACCEEIRTFPYSVQTPNFEKAYGGEGYTNADVIDYVNNTGVGIFNYRGHGSQTQIWDWTNSGPSHFTASEVAQLTNDDQLFVFFDVCCDNMDIVGYNGECLCESFMKHPSGSVAVNGAIIPSYTIPNHDYDKEMYKAVFEEDITNIGYVTNFANITVLNVHGSIGMSNVRTYLWLGDASIEPWTMQPMNLAVSHDEQIFLGMSEFSANVSGPNGAVENAMVCVSNEDGSVYAVAYTDAAGLASITFDEPVQTPGNATVTVTRHNFMPYQALIPVIPQEGPYVVKESYIINDASGGNGNGMMDYGESILFTLSVKNVGIETAEDVVVTLTTSDEYVTITDGEENYGDVEPDEIVSVADGFAFDVAEDLPDGHAVLFEVAASDGTDIWMSNVVITGHAPNLQVGNYTIDDSGGNNNGFLDPGETVEMTVNVENAGSADAYEVIASLTSTDPMLTVLTSDPQTVGDLEPAQQGQAVFSVYADPTIVPGYTGELSILFTADMGVSQEDVILIPFADYCDASTTTEDEWIAQVICGDIDNSSGWQGAVANYTDQTTTIDPGVGEDITIENGNAWASDIVIAWVDWNLDKELGNNGNETFQLTNVGGQGQTFTGTITPPANQPGGQYRMRVRMTYSSAPVPCGNSSYGEVEDYTIIVSGGTMLMPPQNLEAIVVDEDDVMLTWNAPATDDFIGYNVYRDGGMIMEEMTELEYMDMDLEDGTYTYQVCAVYDEGSSAMAGPVQVTISSNPPPPGDAWETFEDYNSGDYLVQQANAMGRDYWDTWSSNPGSAEDPMVSSDYAYAGSNSAVIEGTNDAVLLLGDKTSGKWNLNFQILVPTGFNGYFNVLQEFAGTNSQWGMQAYFDAGGAGLVDAGGAGAGTFTYSYDEWNFVNMNIDLDQDLAEMYVNGAFVVEWVWSSGSFGTGTLNQIGAMNLYAWAENGTPKAYFDDINFSEPTNALIFEPFEEYDANDYLVEQAIAAGHDYWDTWSSAPGTAEDPMVTSDQAFEGSNSIVIEGTNDAVLLFGNQTSGKYAVKFQIYVPTGFNGYFNLLQEFAGTNSQWGMQAYFDAGGLGLVDAGGAGAGTFSYSYDAWTYVNLVVDLNLDWAEMYVDGNEVVQWQWSTGSFGTGTLNQLGAMNLYAWAENGTPKCYFDNIELTESIALAPPTNLVASVDDNDVTLTWTAPAGTDGFLGFNVYRDGETIAEVITETTYSDMDLLPGVYSYDVKAIYDEGYSAGAGPVEATIEGGTAREMVLLEIGTGTWCVYCPGSAMGADEMIENGHDVAIIEYHGGDDYQTVGSDYRLNTYYGISGYPTAWFDGVIVHVGGNATSSLYGTYLPYYETRASKVSLFELDVDTEYTGGTGFDFTITAENIYQYTGQNVVLHVVAIESHIDVTWFVLDEINFVCRKMLPDHMGTAMDFTAQSVYEVDLSLDWNGWDVDNMGLVVFLQDNDTKEVLQATKVEDLGMYVGIEDPISETATTIFPNPATDVVNIVTGSNLHQVRIMNNNGQIVFNQQVEGQNLQVNTSDFQRGVYFMEIHTTEGMITEKLVIR